MSDVETLPRVVVEVDGRPLAEADAETLGEVVVMQQLNAPALCELRYFGPAGGLADGDAAPIGAELRVLVGAERAALFSGDVSGVDHVYGPERGREVRLQAFDRLHRLRLRQPVRAHTQVDLEELANELVGGDDLAVVAHRSSPVWPKLVQFRQTDLDLLAEACERASAYFVVRGGELHLLGLDGAGSARGLELGRTLLEARIGTSARSLCGTVTTEGWDPWTAEIHRGRATAPAAGKRARAGGGLAAGEWHLVGEPVQSVADAEALAQGELDHRAARETVLQGTAEGDAGLAPGVVVEVSGVAPALEGRYVIASATHRIGAETGYVTELSSHPPPVRKRPWGTLLAVGEVTRVDDPDGLGRVRAVLPAYGDLETDWLAVSSPGAGPERGFVAIPDRGDTVLVAFAREDPAQGIVIGSLFGTRRPHDAGVDGNAVQRQTWQTASGHRICLDAAGDSVAIEIGDGSSLTLSPSKVALVANADLEISAAGKAVVIAGSTIDFKKA